MPLNPTLTQMLMQAPALTHPVLWCVMLCALHAHRSACHTHVQREAQIQFNVSNNQTTGIMDTVRKQGRKRGRANR